MAAVSSEAKMPPRLSIKDIAVLANVSHPTVSRALKGSPLVNPETAARIRQIAEQHHFHVSAVAQGLVTRQTLAIGLAVTSIADPFTAEVVRGIEENANRHGYCVLLNDSNADPAREREIVRQFVERRVDGIIVTSSRVGALYLPLLETSGVPIVLVNDQHEGRSIHSVMVDNRHGLAMVLAHLVALGHRRIAYLGDRFGSASDTERLAGYRDGLRAAGIAFRRELIVRGDGRAEGARAAMDELLRLPQRPTAVCCYNDMSALGALRSLHDHDLRVPEDLSLTGFDDLFFAPFMVPALTTLRQPMREMGRLAMTTLLRLMRQKSPPETITVQPELILRHSTGSAR
jgi:DNA-binding LacI/PurR family transcriptional regulator